MQATVPGSRSTDGNAAQGTCALKRLMLKYNKSRKNAQLSTPAFAQEDVWFPT
jgi:hypothetical protein